MCSRVLVLYFLFLLYFYHLFELTPTIFFKWPLVLPSFHDCPLFLYRGFLHDSLWIGNANMVIVWVCHDGVELWTLDQWVQNWISFDLPSSHFFGHMSHTTAETNSFSSDSLSSCGNNHILTLVFFGLCARVLALFFSLILIIYWQLVRISYNKWLVN